MALLYADEDFPGPTIAELRRLGHDVLTAHQADRAGQGIDDESVLAFADSLGRAVLTLNRWHFKGLHRRVPRHSGIITCSDDPDAAGMAERIDATISERVAASGSLAGQLLNVTRPPRPR